MAMGFLASPLGSGLRWDAGKGWGGLVAIALLLALSGCQGQDNATVTAPAPVEGAATSPETLVAPVTDPGPGSSAAAVPGETEAVGTSQAIDNPVQSSHELTPGRYCYSLESETLTAAIGLTVKDDDSVAGESQGTIHNDSAGYYSSYGQTITGSIAQEQLNLELTSYIEDDVQQAQERWSLGNDQLDTGRDVYEQVDCSVVQDQLAVVDDVITGSGYSTEAQLESATAALNDLTDAATNVRVQRLSFAPGASDGVVEDGVVRAERNQYLVGAAAGQTLALSISALENNVAFGLVAPDGSVLFYEETNVEVSLPQSGDYSIVVGGTRGNASYRLTVEIR